MGETDLCAITRTLWSSAEESLAAYLSPQQVAVGVPGGLSILVHGVRELLTHRPDFVVVRLDLANAYNTIDRAVAASQRPPQAPPCAEGGRGGGGRRMVSLNPLATITTMGSIPFLV